MPKFDFSYDKDQDDLFLFDPKNKSKGSVEIGDIVIDYNFKKDVVGIQMINASKVIQDLVDQKLSDIKKFLVNLQECEVTVKQKNNFLIIKLRLFNGKKEISSTINVPSITQSSPALAYTCMFLISL